MSDLSRPMRSYRIDNSSTNEDSLALTKCGDQLLLCQVLKEVECKDCLDLLVTNVGERFSCHPSHVRVERNAIDDMFPACSEVDSRPTWDRGMEIDRLPIHRRQEDRDRISRSIECVEDPTHVLLYSVA